MRTPKRPVVAFLALIALSSSAGLYQTISVRDPSVPAPAGGGGDSTAAIVSADGRYVVFASTAENLVVTSGDPAISGLQPRRLNVFVRDRTNGTTALVSVNSSGSYGGNGDSLPLAISTNNQFILFESSASDLVAGDANGASDIFVRNLLANTTALVSVSTGGGSGNGASRNAVMTPDGRYVAFVSAATNLVANDTNGIPDVFVRDLQSSTTVLASVSALGDPLSGSDSPEITPDGRFVAFFSTATNLVPDITTSGEVYVRDLNTTTTACASTNARSVFQSVFGSTDVISCNHKISADGRYVGFEACTNLPSGLSAAGIILRHDLQTGLTDIVNTNANVPQAVFADIKTLDMTQDGRFIVFIGNTNVPVSAQCIYRWDAQTTNTVLISQDLSGVVASNTICDWPRMDASGRYIAFLCNATNLTTNALAGEFHLYVRDTQTGDALLLDVDTNSMGAGVSASDIPTFNGDARCFAFDSPDGYLVANDRNRASDVFLRDVVADSTELISAHEPSLPSLLANGSSSLNPRVTALGFTGSGGLGSVSTNGRYVAFVSDATDLVPDDTNSFPDVFVRDLQTGTNILVSGALGGGTANGLSYEPSISGDGRYVAFTSGATNLVVGDSNNATDVFIRDLQSGTTTLVTISTNGTSSANGDSRSPSLSSDGTKVLFWSKASTLAPGSSTSGFENLYLRDLATGTNVVLTTGGINSSSMTPDGKYVVYAPSGSIQYVWDVQAAMRVLTNSPAFGGTSSISPGGNRVAYYDGSTLYVKDRMTNTNWVVSVITGGDPKPGFNSDGRYVAYQTTAVNVSGDTNGEVDIYVYDTLASSNSLISWSYLYPTPANAASDPSVISLDGRFVAYRTLASNVVPNDTNDVPDVVLYDRLNNATILISTSQSQNRVARNRSSAPVFSGDSKMLFFQSWASDLTAGDFNNGSDIFAVQLVANPITDTDNDGMDDQWEMDYFQTLARTGTNDFDLDGGNDLLEFQSGTNPTNAASVFRAEIGRPLAPNQSPSLTWPANPWKTYRVQFKNDLGDASWQDLPGNVTLFGNSGTANDSSPNADRRFYRILLNP